MLAVLTNKADSGVKGEVIKLLTEFQQNVDKVRM